MPARIEPTPAGSSFSGSLGADALDAGNLFRGKFGVHFVYIVAVLVVFCGQVVPQKSFQFFGSTTGAGAKPPWRAKRVIDKIVGGTLVDWLVFDG